MAIEHIHTHLVYPGKGDRPVPEGRGAEVSKEGKLFDLLNDIYTNAMSQCDIDIAFNPSSSGKQENPCRDLLIGYVHRPSLISAEAIGHRLRLNTDGRSGMGLLFIMIGRENSKTRIVISRFPANSAILVEEGAALSVEFLERVFVKNAGTYKAAAFEDVSSTTGFWLGKAVDRQISSRDLQLSDYWVKDFLDADLRATAAAGTRRLAAALREASRKATDVETKTKIAAAVTLAAGSMGGQLTSIEMFCDKFGLDSGVRELVQTAAKTPSVYREQFKLDVTEFNEQIAYRSVELDTGAIVMAPTEEFDDVVTRERTGDGERFSVEGRVVDEKLAKGRA